MEKMTFESYSKTLKKRRVLDNISVTFHRGCIYKITGSNGSGKTMLLRAAAGLIYPTTGYLRIDDVIIQKGGIYPASRGVIIENPSFWGDYTGEDFLRYLASIRGVIGRSEIQEAMMKMKLDPGDRRRIKKYSLGMKQKLGIVQAIMEKPDVLLLDEPLNALDADAIHLFEDVLLEEKKRGAMVLIALHNEGAFRVEYDGIFRMEEGRLYAG